MFVIPPDNAKFARTLGSSESATESEIKTKKKEIERKKREQE